MALDARHLFLVPPCEADSDGELNVLGVRQARALGDAFGDVPLRAVYTGPGLASEDTAEAIAQRHGLVVRRKPALGLSDEERFDAAAARIIEVFETIARAGSGRTSLVALAAEAARIIVAHCTGVAPSVDDRLMLPPASITEITIEETLYSVERVGDITHLPPLTRSPREDER
jgi:broad specificity phosphatase PhoE